MHYTKEKLEQLAHRWTTPHGKKLLAKIKETKCYLNPVLYRQVVKNLAGINDDEVKEDIDLRGAVLAGFDFRVTIDQNDDGYTESAAQMANVHFEGANLRSAKFQNAKLYRVHFDNADLSHAEFNGATLNNCYFIDADCTGINLQAAKLIDCNLTEASLKDVVLDNTIVDEKTNFGKELRSEKNKNFHYASIEYKQIKEMYKNSSLHAIADKFHYKEMVARRKITSIKSPKRWLNYFFGDLLCKYGTSFNRVILWSLILVISCAALYTNSNGLLYQNEEIAPNFISSLYFSLVTFTTLGYGDYHTVGLMRFVASLQSLLGASLIALFTVIVARNIIRD